MGFCNHRNSLGITDGIHAPREPFPGEQANTGTEGEVRALTGCFREPFRWQPPTVKNPLWFKSCVLFLGCAFTQGFWGVNLPQRNPIEWLAQSLLYLGPVVRTRPFKSISASTEGVSAHSYKQHTRKTRKASRCLSFTSILFKITNLLNRPCDRPHRDHISGAALTSNSPGKAFRQIPPSRTSGSAFLLAIIEYRASPRRTGRGYNKMFCLYCRISYGNDAGGLEWSTNKKNITRRIVVDA